MEEDEYRLMETVAGADLVVISPDLASPFARLFEKGWLSERILGDGQVTIELSASGVEALAAERIRRAKALNAEKPG